ncbi:MAG: HAD family hydrolase [Pseudomonadota bacterium]
MYRKANDLLVVFDLFGVVFSKGLAGAIGELEHIFQHDRTKIAEVYETHEPAFDLGEINEREFWRLVNRDLDRSVNARILSNLVISDYRVRKDVISLIKNVQRNFEVVVYSNYRHEWFQRLDRKHGISKVVPQIYISSITKILKPDQEVFNLLSTEHSKPVENIVLIDDNIANIEGANSAGATGLLYSSTDIIYEQMIKELGCSLIEFDYYCKVLLIRGPNGSIFLQRRRKNSIMFFSDALAPVYVQESNEISSKLATDSAGFKRLASLVTEPKHQKTISISLPLDRWACVEVWIADVIDLDLFLNEFEDIEAVWPSTYAGDSSHDPVGMIIRSVS